MARIFLLSFGLMIVLLMAVNAAWMLISPQAWFHLPRWLRAQGSLSELRYSKGRGALELRLAGAVILLAIIWIAWQLLVKA